MDETRQPEPLVGLRPIPRRGVGTEGYAHRSRRAGISLVAAALIEGATEERTVR